MERKTVRATPSAQPATCPGQQVVTCGNGAFGTGAPGERQVNDPAQDAAAPDRNITQSETTIAHSGPFVLMGFNDTNCAAFDNISGFAFSSDAGATWSDCGSMPLNTGWRNGGDPSVAVDSSGVFYYGEIGDDATGESIIALFTATADADRRLHVNPARVVGRSTHPGTFPPPFEDKEWVVVGPDPSRPGQEAVYVTWTDFTETGVQDFIRFTKLTTGVNPSVLIPPKNIASALHKDITGSFPAVDPSGNLYVIYMHFGLGQSVQMVKSTDGGKTFSGPVIISNFESASNAIVQCDDEERPVILVRPGKAIRQLNFPQAAAGPDGTVYAVWADGRNLETTGSIDIFLAYSTDGGDTWTTVPVTNGPTHAFFPSIAVDERGAHIQYNMFCGPGIGVGAGTFALFKKHFTIAGGFTPEEMVSTVCSEVPDNQPFNFDTEAGGCYMGDYNQLIIGENGALWHAYGDNRNDPRGNNPDVFFIQQGGLPPTAIECVLVDKVYDFCFEEDAGLQDCIPIPASPCAESGATARATITEVRCAAGPPVPTGVDGFSTVRVTVTAMYFVEIFHADGTFLCAVGGRPFTFTKTVTVCGPAGTTANCEVRAAVPGPSVILPPTPEFPQTALVCTELSFCVLVETTARVKLLVPSFGFCTPARCQTGGFPPGVCPPSPLFPPQCAATAD